MEKLITLKEKTFNIIDSGTVKVKEQTLFKANGEEGLHLWEAAVVLSRWSVINNSIFYNKRVLELGSGCGLLGIALLKYTDSKEVVFSDYIDSVIKNLNFNIKDNEDKHKHKNTIFEVSEIKQKDSYPNNCVSCYKNRYNVIKLNWIDYQKYDSLKEEEKYDIIIGTELVYQGGPLKELSCIISNLLKKEGGICYISMPKQRSMTGVFLDLLKENKLIIEEEQLNDDLLYKNKIINNKDEEKLFEDLKKMNIMLYKIKHSQ